MLQAKKYIWTCTFLIVNLVLSFTEVIFCVNRLYASGHDTQLGDGSYDAHRSPGQCSDVRVIVSCHVKAPPSVFGCAFLVRVSCHTLRVSCTSGMVYLVSRCL